MRTALFDVVISTSSDDEDPSAVFISVGIIDRYHGDGDELIAQSGDFDSLDAAIEYARGAVTAFMRGTSGDPQ